MSRVLRDTKPNRPYTAAQAKRLLARLDALIAHDSSLFKADPSLDAIIGVDEVGRGSLIGPVVAAGCVITRNTLTQIPDNWLGLDDSKASHHSHSSRLALSQAITQHTTGRITEATQAEVEALNVHHASLLASRRAFGDCIEHLLSRHPSITHVLLLLDGRHVLKKLDSPKKGLKISQQAIIKGDGQSAAIAAASILAKASRDSWVLQEASALEHAEAYGWASNMGYATATHRQAIERFGLTPLHRRTFKLK